MKLIHRIKILLAVLQELGSNIEENDFQLLLFLYCTEFVENNHYYDFIPQKTGPFSIQANADKEFLIKKSVLESGKNWISKSSERFATGLDFFEKLAIQKMKNELVVKSGEALKIYIAERYPEFFAVGGVEDAKENEIILFTIGYEGLSPEAYIQG